MAHISMDAIAEMVGDAIISGRGVPAPASVMRQLGLIGSTHERYAAHTIKGPFEGFDERITGGCKVKAIKNIFDGDEMDKDDEDDNDEDQDIVYKDDIGIVVGYDKHSGLLECLFPRVEEPMMCNKDDVEYEEIAQNIAEGARVTIREGVRKPSSGKWGPLKKLKHRAIGFVDTMEKNGSCKVNFGVGDLDKPATFQLSELEIYYQPKNIIDGSVDEQSDPGPWEEDDGRLQLGMAVRVPESVTEPSCKWGGVTHDSIGYLRAYDRNKNIYTVGMPDAPNWRARGADLEEDKVASKLRPGCIVRIKSEIGRVRYGWGEVTHDSKGPIMGCLKNGIVVVHFDEHPAWHGLLSEIEIAQGDRESTPVERQTSDEPTVQAEAVTTAEPVVVEAVDDSSEGNNTNPTLTATAGAALTRQLSNDGPPALAPAVAQSDNASPERQSTGATADASAGAPLERTYSAQHRAANSIVTADAQIMQAHVLPPRRFADGFLVSITGLTSEKGLTWNGQVCIVRGISSTEKYQVSPLSKLDTVYLIAESNLEEPEFEELT